MKHDIFGEMDDILYEYRMDNPCPKEKLAWVMHPSIFREFVERFEEEPRFCDEVPTIKPPTIFGIQIFVKREAPEDQILLLPLSDVPNDPS